VAISHNNAELEIASHAPFATLGASAHRNDNMKVMQSFLLMNQNIPILGEFRINSE